MDSSGLAKSSGEREGVDSSDKCRLLVAATVPNSNMDDTVHCIVPLKGNAWRQDLVDNSIQVLTCL